MLDEWYSPLVLSVFFHDVLEVEAGNPGSGVLITEMYSVLDRAKQLVSKEEAAMTEQYRSNTTVSFNGSAIAQYDCKFPRPWL